MQCQVGPFLSSNWRVPGQQSFEAPTRHDKKRAAIGCTHCSLYMLRNVLGVGYQRQCPGVWPGGWQLKTKAPDERGPFQW